MMSDMLEIDDVYTAYDKADVLQGVSLAVKSGSITCLLGSNGSGKTTLVRSILGLTPARAGRIIFDGTDITRIPTHKIVAAGIACIPEGRKVFPKLTVEENLRVGAYQETSEKITQARMADIFRIYPRLAERRAQLAGTTSTSSARSTNAASPYSWSSRTCTRHWPSHIMVLYCQKVASRPVEHLRNLRIARRCAMPISRR
jgi:ABC-type branched-subunit amino acid transport system ATPase component